MYSYIILPLYSLYFCTVGKGGQDLPRLLCLLIGGRHSGLCVPFRPTVLTHFIGTVFKFFSTMLVRHDVNCRCSTYGSCGYASHKDIGGNKLQRKQHFNLPDDVFNKDVGVCACYAICILSQSSIKISADAPLTPILYLARRNASRVPVLGSGWENPIILADSVRCITICRQLLDTA